MEQIKKSPILSLATYKKIIIVELFVTIKTIKRIMKISILIPAVLSLISFTACSQNAAQQQNKAGGTKQLVGGSCEGCEAIYEQGPSFDTLSAVATLPDFNEPGTRIAISGIVYQRDQRTPAKDVVIYIYHTDQSGKYVAKAGQTGWASGMDISVDGLKRISMVFTSSIRFGLHVTLGAMQ